MEFIGQELLLSFKIQANYGLRATVYIQSEISPWASPPARTAEREGPSVTELSAFLVVQRGSAGHLGRRNVKYFIIFGAKLAFIENANYFPAESHSQ